MNPLRFFTAFGAAPAALAGLAVISGALILITDPSKTQARPDLTFTVFSKEHRADYEKVIPAFETREKIKVGVQLVDHVALHSRLQAALQSGAAVPDVVELEEPSIGIFARGPLADVGLLDLTDRVAASGLKERMVASRFGLWSSRGHIFALPHDVHPVALAYRKDLVEAAGITSADLLTWDSFVAAGRRIAQDANHDGIPDQYLIDLPTDGGFGLNVLLWQAGGGYFDADGQVRFDDDIALKTLLWYVRATRGPQRVAVTCGWGQPLARAASEGLALFYVVADWRTKQFELDMPQLAGKMALCPLPAWQPGGRRTSTWGGTGLAITKACKDPDRAWRLVEALYLDVGSYGARFADSNIIPPVQAAWKLPELATPSSYWSNQPLGTLYAELANEVPEIHVTAYEGMARGKFSEAFLDVALRYEAMGDEGLEDFARARLSACAGYVRSAMARNRFLTTRTEKAP